VEGLKQAPGTGGDPNKKHEKRFPNLGTTLETIKGCGQINSVPITKASPEEDTAGGHYGSKERKGPSVTLSKSNKQKSPSHQEERDEGTSKPGATELLF